VENAFGSEIDYAQLIKIYGNAPENGEVLATALPFAWDPERQ
jgi:hypothetical protein